MKQRKPGDYVVNAELTDEQRERFVKDCVAAGATFGGCHKSHKYTSYCAAANICQSTSLPGGFAAHIEEMHRDCTDEYKDNPMTQPDLMEQIAAAMRRNPDGWPQSFEIYSGGKWYTCYEPGEIFDFVEGAWHRLRPKPRTYTLHVEDMPVPLREEPNLGAEYWAALPDAETPPKRRWNRCRTEMAWLKNGMCYPDKESAQQAMDKLKAAMGGRDE